MKVYKFGKRGCGPCRMAGMMVDKLAAKYNVEAVAFDVLDNPDLLEQYGIKSVPCVLILDNNNTIYIKNYVASLCNSLGCFCSINSNLCKSWRIKR